MHVTEQIDIVRADLGSTSQRPDGRAVRQYRLELTPFEQVIRSSLVVDVSDLPAFPKRIADGRQALPFAASLLDLAQDPLPHTAKQRGADPGVRAHPVHDLAEALQDKRRVGVAIDIPRARRPTDTYQRVALAIEQHHERCLLIAARLDVVDELPVQLGAAFRVSERVDIREKLGGRAVAGEDVGQTGGAAP